MISDNMGNKYTNNINKNKEQKIEIKCINLNEFGQGVFKVNNEIKSANNLLPGESAIVSINADKCRVINLLNKSKKRVDVKCGAYNKCGSCHLLHMNYNEQIKFKEEYVNNCFKQNNIKANVKEIEKASILEGYRNKMTVAYKYSDGKIVYGFYEEDTHRIVSNDYCFVHTKEQNEIVKAIGKIMTELHISCYDEDKRKGLMRYAQVRFSRFTKEILVTLVTNGNVFPSRSEFIKRLRNICPYITSIVQNINSRKTSIILGDEEQVLYGRGYIEDEICGIKFNISSKTFFQVNPYQVEVLYRKVSDYLELQGNEVVLDAYCGVGTIGLSIAKNAKYVYGVENNKQSVINARTNASNNKIRNINFICADATDYIIEMTKMNAKFDCLIMDPPRTGSTEKFLYSVNKLAPKKIVYVSCEAKTLARDLKILLDKYEIQNVGIVDMFIGTYHVETVVCLVRK